jgi:GNAT superfamily N-acetyltransferase
MQTPKTVISLKRVNQDNFADFLGLVIKLAEYEKLTPPDEAAQNRLKNDCLQNPPRYQAILAKVNGKPAGYLIYFYTYSSFLALPTLYLEDIFVLEEFRKMLVGKTLFNFVKVQAKDAGCGRIEFTVLKWNKLAQDFYKKNGAHCLEDWDFYRVVKEDF